MRSGFLMSWPISADPPTRVLIRAAASGTPESPESPGGQIPVGSRRIGPCPPKGQSCQWPVGWEHLHGARVSIMNARFKP